MSIWAIAVRLTQEPTEVKPTLADDKNFWLGVDLSDRRSTQ